MTHLTPRDYELIRSMRADGYTQEETARVVGCCIPTVRRLAPGWPGKVSNARLRAAFLESPVTASSVARYLGWSSPHRGRPSPSPDTSRVKRTLGLLPTIGNGHTQTRQLIDWETGSLIAEAIGVAAWSVLDEDSQPVARPDGQCWGEAA